MDSLAHGSSLTPPATSAVVRLGMTLGFGLGLFVFHSSRFIRAVLLVAVVVMSTLVHAAPPTLQVEAGKGMDEIAEGIRNGDPARFEVIMDIVGLDDAGKPILVLVAPESSLLAQRAPKYIAGYARSDEDFIVLFPARATVYPIDGMEELLRHEIAHVLIYRASGHTEIPRWFNEGLATVAGDSWGLPDRGRFTLAMLRGERTSLNRVEKMFYEGPAQAAKAYAISGAFAYDLLRRQGPEAGARVLEELKEGHDFLEAFKRGTGKSLHEFERDFWKRKTLWNRWIPWATSSVALWAFITLFAMWVMRVKRRRDRLRLEAMELADELADLQREEVN